MDVHKLLPYATPPTVAVIGDVCLDLYYFTGTEGAEISVETNLQSYSVFDSKQDLGGAGNVAVNCKTLGAKRVDIYGITGNDCWGNIVRDLFAKRGVGSEGLLLQENGWQTHVYHKVYAGREELPRYDMGNKNRPMDSTVDALLELFESRLDEYQCVIINEQVPSGLHSPYFQKKLNALIERKRNRPIWFADCRKLNDCYQHTIRKLNIREAGEILAANGVTVPRDTEPLHFTADWLYNHWGLPLVLTLGEEGALVRDETGFAEINSIHLLNEIDIVGAGDAFLAGLVTSFAAGHNLRDSAAAGTFSAAVALGKLFETGHPTAGEVIALAEEADFNYNPRLAADDSLAQYAAGTEIEITGHLFNRGKNSPPKIAIFDHDGTISVLREGWEEVMRKVMFDAITGGIRKSGSGLPPQLSGTEIARVYGEISSFIEKTTGIQTIAQMYRLKDMVRSFAYVKDNDILEPGEYKEIYNRALLDSMEKRLIWVKEGKLSAFDVSVKGAVEFLRKLTFYGTKLYLASGTDQNDVIKEAGILGYAHLFTGGIRGSLGDIKNDPKKLVMRGIIAEIKAAGGNPADVVVFGDGPVEMREAKKAGFLAVGILSDERRRWGSNQDKRKRLILGGADILMPDFSWSGELAALCGWE